MYQLIDERGRTSMPTLDLILTIKSKSVYVWMSENKQKLKEVLHVWAGLMVTERNWLEVYPYTRWGGNDSLPHLQQGQTFMPSHLMLKEVSHLDLLALQGHQQTSHHTRPAA